MSINKFIKSLVRKNVGAFIGHDKEGRSVTWKYRVVKEGGLYSIREVYYEVYYKDGKINSWTDGLFDGEWDFPDELRASLEMMVESLDKSVLLVDGDMLVEKGLLDK